MNRREFLGIASVGVCGVVAGCTASGDRDGPDVVGKQLTLTTTTSTYDTGLLDELNSAFEDRYGATVNTVAQGTGAALATAERGDSDVVLVHARSLEDEFIREGYGVNRRDLMFNDFVVVGPESDPAGIDGTDSVTEAFRTIAETESTFVSRGDSSGTHAAELGIWAEAGIEPRGNWYRETGSGMGEVLTQASLSEAYTLADRGTYRSMRSEIDLRVLVQGPIEGGPELLANPYGIMAVNPGLHDTVEYDLAMAYIGFLTSPEGQALIAEFTVDGQQLFFPEAVSEDPNFQQYVPEGWTGENED